jgi:glucosylceramidase
MLESYFDADAGIGYTVGRVPIGGCDFSTRKYTYDDNAVGDFLMVNFSLVTEDIEFKIPAILDAERLANRSLTLFGSPWSAPAWMKTNNKLNGQGQLKGTAGDEYHQAWARYLLTFLQLYSRYGVDFWGITAQNEPTDGNTPLCVRACVHTGDALTGWLSQLSVQLHGIHGRDPTRFHQDGSGTTAARGIPADEVDDSR